MDNDGVHSDPLKYTIFLLMKIHFLSHLEIHLLIFRDAKVVLCGLEFSG